MFTGIRPRLTYANVMATLAMFVAMGGSSYAALTVTSRNVRDGTLTSADLKNNAAVKSADVVNGSLLTKDFKAGQLPAGPAGPQGNPGVSGAKGDPGEPATRLFAKVTDAGALQYGSGATGATRGPSPPYSYTVSFNRNLTGCVALAAPGFGHPQVPDAADADLPVIVDVQETSVNVNFWNDNIGAYDTTGFHLTVFC